MKLESSRQIFEKKKKNLIPNFMKIRLVGARMFHEDGRRDEETDVTKLKIFFPHFANASDKAF